jgi:hypothetical protein
MNGKPLPNLVAGCYGKYIFSLGAPPGQKSQALHCIQDVNP